MATRIAGGHPAEPDRHPSDVPPPAAPMAAYGTGTQPVARTTAPEPTGSRDEYDQLTAPPQLVDTDAALAGFLSRMQEDLMQPTSWLRQLVTSDAVRDTVHRLDDPAGLLGRDKEALLIKLDPDRDPTELGYRDEKATGDRGAKELQILTHVLVGDAGRMDRLGSGSFLDYLLAYCTQAGSNTLPNLLQAMAQTSIGQDRRLIDAKGVVRDRLLPQGDTVVTELVAVVRGRLGEGEAHNFVTGLHSTKSGNVSGYVERFCRPQANEDVAKVFGDIRSALAQEDNVFPQEVRDRLLGAIEERVGMEARAQAAAALARAQRDNDLAGVVTELRETHKAHSHVLGELAAFEREANQQARSVRALRDALNDLAMVADAAARSAVETRLKTELRLTPNEGSDPFYGELIRAAKLRPKKFEELLGQEEERCANPLLYELKSVLKKPENQLSLTMLRARLQLYLPALLGIPADVDKDMLPRAQREQPREKGRLRRAWNATKEVLGSSVEPWSREGRRSYVRFAYAVGRGVRRFSRWLVGPTFIGIPVPRLRRMGAVLGIAAILSYPPWGPYVWRGTFWFADKITWPVRAAGRALAEGLAGVGEAVGETVTYITSEPAHPAPVRPVPALTRRFGVEEPSNIAFIETTPALHEWLAALPQLGYRLDPGRSDELVAILQRWKELHAAGDQKGVDTSTTGFYASFADWAIKQGFAHPLPKPTPPPEPTIQPDAGTPEVQPEPSPAPASAKPRRPSARSRDPARGSADEGMPELP